jgi:hypothetical protein
MTLSRSRREFMQGVAEGAFSIGLLAEMAKADDAAPAVVTMTLVGGARIHAPGYVDKMKNRKEIEENPLIPVPECAKRSSVMEALYQGSAAREWVKPV